MTTCPGLTVAPANSLLILAFVTSLAIRKKMTDKRGQRAQTSRRSTPPSKVLMPRTEGNATCVVARCTHGMFWPTTEGHAASRGSWRQACGRQERFSRPHAFRGKTRERERERERKG
ncbi:unnamed protein product [Ixodes persulcatus]